MEQSTWSRARKHIGGGVTVNAAKLKQKGFGIVELMIGLLIGAILVVLVTDMFNANKAVQNRIMSQSRLQENARFAYMFLSSEIHKVGYRLNPEDIPQYAFRGYDFKLVEAWNGDDDSADVFARHGTTTISVHGTDVNLANVADDSDVLMLTRQSDGTSRDCVDNNVVENPSADPADQIPAVGWLVLSIYYVAVSDATTSDKGSFSRFALHCKPVYLDYVGGVVNTSGTVKRNAAQLVEDVTNLQVLLAQDTNGSGVPNSYITPSATMGVSNGVDVVAVDIKLTVKGGRTLDLLESAGATTLSKSEQSLSLTLGGAVAYRNQAP
jgi:Tfp pilus assembly protein PilW